TMTGSVSSIAPSAPASSVRGMDNQARLRVPWRTVAVALIILIATFGYTPGHAQAARVSGVLTGYESSNPLVSRDLHFQNNITRDIYLSPTHHDGSFAVILPPG